MNNYHILQVKGMPVTNENPARVKILSERFETSIIIPYTNEPGSISPALPTAIEWLINHGYKLIGQGEGNGHYYIISETFKCPKEAKTGKRKEYKY